MATLGKRTMECLDGQQYRRQEPCRRRAASARTIKTRRTFKRELTVHDVQRDVGLSQQRRPAGVDPRVVLARAPDGQGAHGRALGDVLGRAYL